MKHKTHAEFVAAHSTTDIARSLTGRLTRSICNGWKARDSIPASYWMEFSVFSTDRGVPCTPHMLAMAAQEKRLAKS